MKFIKYVGNEHINAINALCVCNLRVKEYNGHYGIDVCTILQNDYFFTLKDKETARKEITRIVDFITNDETTGVLEVHNDCD